MLITVDLEGISRVQFNRQMPQAATKAEQLLCVQQIACVAFIRKIIGSSLNGAMNKSSRQMVFQLKVCSQQNRDVQWKLWNYSSISQ